jgi:hypothetical protein
LKHKKDFLIHTMHCGGYLAFRAENMTLFNSHSGSLFPQNSCNSNSVNPIFSRRASHSCVVNNVDRASPLYFRAVITFMQLSLPPMYLLFSSREDKRLCQTVEIDYCQSLLGLPNFPELGGKIRFPKKIRILKKTQIVMLIY